MTGHSTESKSLYKGDRKRKRALVGYTFHDLANCLFIAFILIKPIYILPSGSLQIGDILLLTSFICVLIDEGMSFRIDRSDFLFISFVGAVILIDAFYACVYQSYEFMKYAAYYVFNGIAVLLFRRMLVDRSLLSRLIVSWRITLLIQAMLYFLNIGRWYDSSRYMGSFNDPNQLGFFVLSTFVLIKVVTYKQRIKECYLDDIVSIILVFETGSTGMLLGLAIYYIGKTVCYMKAGGTLRWPAMVLLIGIIAFLFLILSKAEIVIFSTGNNTVDTMINRVIQKLNKLSGGDSYNNSIIIDRGLDKIFLYPEKILYGAGEGMFSRFVLASASNELHSTVFGLLFYYGIIPFIVLTAWVVSNFRRGGVSLEVVMLYIAPLVECLTLANQRQPAFWLLLTLAALPVSSDKTGRQLLDRQDEICV